MIESQDTNLRVFNTAKKFAEEILFPIMETYQKFKRQSDFGSENLDDAKMLNDEIKDIERYNGLKGMNDTLSSLIIAISSTVRLKGNAQEVKKLEELKETVEKIKNIFYNHKHLFFSQSHRGMNIVDQLDRSYFEKVKTIVETCYINTEILMTRNKLLFADSKDDFMTDQEIRDSIKSEYIEG